MPIYGHFAHNAHMVGILTPITLAQPEAASSGELSNSFVGRDRDIFKLASDIRRDPGDEVLQAFTRGELLLRDISFLTRQQRALIRHSDPEEIVRGIIPRAKREIIKIPAESLHYWFSEENRSHLQQNAGRNFLVNAEGFLDAGYPEARLFDQRLKAWTKERYGRALGIKELLSTLRAMEGRDGGSENVACSVIHRFSGDTSNVNTIGVYLAARSKWAEDYQNQEYGEYLTQAKDAVRLQINRLRSQGILRDQEADTALRKLSRVNFSSFDHLLAGVTVGDRGASGDYLPGSLSVELKFRGNVANPSSPSAYDAVHTLIHEVFHGCAAQDVERNRQGLSYGSAGRDVDEAMTEYLTQLALGLPPLRTNAEGQSWFMCSYKQEVLALHALRLSSPADFNVLCRAYFGASMQKGTLARALSSYYERLDSIRPVN